MSVEALKGVMIGAGYFAQFQIESWQRIPGAKISAIADRVPERAEQFAARWEISQAYSNAERMLEREKPDFVDIVAPPQSHLALTKLAAEHGIQVICQKPMAPCLKDCLEMVDVCAAKGVRLIIHENWRWQPWFREIKRLSDDGVLGKPFYAGYVMRNGDGWGPEAYPTQPYFCEMERLLVYEMVVHFLDTFRFLVGEIASVLCRLKKLNPWIKGEDAMLAQFTFENGADGLIDANRFTGRPFPAKTVGDFTLEGERAKIRSTPTGELYLTEYGNEERAHEFISPVRGYKGDSVHAAQQHYLACLGSGQQCESEGKEYLKTVAAVFACYESSATGQIIIPQKMFTVS